MKYIALLALLFLVSHSLAQTPNLLVDPSIEQTQQKNQFGIPYSTWSGWIFEGSSEFRNASTARTGNTCAEIIGSYGGKIRLYSPTVPVQPGLYRFSCYIRGLDISDSSTLDFNTGDDEYYSFKKAGTFDWTRLEFVKEIKTSRDVVMRIGLWGNGRLWVDDAELVQVAENTPVTAAPVLESGDKPIDPPSAIDPANAVGCPDCGYRNMPGWKHCYACGAALAEVNEDMTIDPVKFLTSFEGGEDANLDLGENAKLVKDQYFGAEYSLKIDRDFVKWNASQDWTGYDFFKTDVYNASTKPVQFYFEVRDKATTDYWTRVNYFTVIPPGKSTLTIPTDLYVGEKSRPGRPLDKANINMVAFNIGNAKAPVYFGNLRLERDLSDSVKVPGLLAFSFNPGKNPPLSGFTSITPSTQYSPARSYGLKNAAIWRAFDFLQPDPLYQVCICIESGGFAVDLPDGKYHVFVNLDGPSGFWGEYQIYRERIVKANGVEVVRDTMDLERFKKKYFRFADVEDNPLENTFDKYQLRYFQEKEFDVDVKGGQLYLEFIGQSWANCISALIIYPAAEASSGKKYLANLRERRRFYFDNYFKRILPDGRKDAKGTIPEYIPSAAEKSLGMVVWSRDWMQDVPVNATPRKEEVVDKLSIFASAGQMEPVVFCATPLKDLGEVKVSVSSMKASSGAVIPASAIGFGVVSHRLSRITPEGTVYTIAPRLIVPGASAELKKGVTTTFWLTFRAPEKVKAGTYTGKIKLTLANGKTRVINLSARLFSKKLDQLDIPAGPWGCNISLPWYEEDLGDYNHRMYLKCLKKMREYGLTAFSGIPNLRISEWKEGKPVIDFAQADREMSEAKAAGFKMFVNYNGGILGFDNYFIDENAMRNAGYDSYTDFLKAVLVPVAEHAKAANWLPFAFNLCDEPLGETLARSASNAQAWKDASPANLLTTGATSMENPQPDNPHLPLIKALKIANLNLHDEAAIKSIHDTGNDWAFYNGGNRWTFGTYMYKCTQEYDMKFRLSWHWNASAGDPYYALDCREDDYAWCVANSKGELIPTIHFDRDIRAGIDDYRYMLTLANLIKAKPNHPAAASAKKLLKDKLSAFKLGEREHDAKWQTAEYREYRLKLAQAIEKFSK